MIPHHCEGSRHSFSEERRNKHFSGNQFEVILEATRMCQKKTTVFETKDINEIEDKTLPKETNLKLLWV
jgi:hypothetical protein